jgi:ABC-type phosphate transport system permease subunit
VQTRGSGVNAFEALYLVGFVLFVFTLLLNIMSERFVRKYRRSY